MTGFLKICAILIIIAFLAGCAAGPNQNINAPNEGGNVAGFWSGLWHGIITPVTFIISLFSPHVNIYEVHNNGGWYNLGFIFGLMIIFGGSGGGTVKMRCKKDQ
ncbi:MAG: hypothetical protein JW822_14475 [Spirochaetales bacterium]|nr:hypothetical protein [Spirochaetales bacterium]